jgi:hypothetical protein
VHGSTDQWMREGQARAAGEHAITAQCLSGAPRLGAGQLGHGGRLGDGDVVAAEDGDGAGQRHGVRPGRREARADGTPKPRRAGQAIGRPRHAPGFEQLAEEEGDAAGGGRRAVTGEQRCGTAELPGHQRAHGAGAERRHRQNLDVVAQREQLRERGRTGGGDGPRREEDRQRQLRDARRETGQPGEGCVAGRVGVVEDQDGGTRRPAAPDRVGNAAARSPPGHHFTVIPRARPAHARNSADLPLPAGPSKTVIPP